MMGKKVKCLICGREIDVKDAVKPIINCTLGWYDPNTGLCELTGNLCDYEEEYLCKKCAEKSVIIDIYECIWEDEYYEDDLYEEEWEDI